MSRFLRILRHRLRGVTRPAAVDTELSRELTFHLDHLSAEYEADGLTPADARRAAQRTLGNVPLLADQVRDQQGLAWLGDLRQDLAYALRTLARTPRVTLVMLASLALGIGANVAVFGVLDAALREPLPVPDADQVVVARTAHRDRPDQYANALLSDYVAWRERNRSFASLGVGFGNQADFAADDGAPVERVAGMAVNAELFEVLRVRPVAGRLFAEDESRHAIRPVVLSHGLWQRRYGGDPNVVGRLLRLNATPARVVGVMPEEFRFPRAGVEFWSPLAVDRGEATPQRFFLVVGRLKPGVSAEQAEADLDRIAAQLARERPALNDGWSVGVAPLRTSLLGWMHQPLATLAAAVALVLLVACTNVAGLLLARTMARRPELIVRSAIGAGRARLVRQLLSEGVLIAAGGALLGIGVAWGGARTLLAVTPPLGGIPLGEPDLRWRIVALTAVLTPIAGVLCAIVPALVGSRIDVPDLAPAATRATGARTPRLRESLVAAQVGVTFVLLIGAGLLGQSFLRMVGRELHYDPRNLLTFEVTLPPAEFMRRSGMAHGEALFDIAPTAAQTFARMQDALARLPGATAVAGISTPLLNAIVIPQVTVEGGAPGDHEEPFAATRRRLGLPYYVVTPGFFTAMRAAVTSGRDFTPADTSGARWVAIVNESAARELWPGMDPIGQLVRLPLVPDERPREVVGVVRDMPQRLRQVEVMPAVFTPFLQQPPRFPQTGANMFGRMTFMIRSAGDPMALLPAARQAVAAIDPERPLANIMPLDQHLRLSNPQGGGVAMVLGLFALVATLLAGIGIYGIVSYAAARRTREIGIRMALGAGGRQITMLVSGRALVFVAAGLTAGGLASVPLTYLLRSQLWGVEPTDSATYAGALLFMAAVAALASLLPTRRAVALNPTVALRE